MMTENCVIVSAKRTPFGKYLGSLSQMEPLDVAVHAANSTLDAAGTEIRDKIDQIFVGNCIPGAFETASVTGRQIGLKLGLDVFTTTIDTACCSPLSALRMALWGLRLGEIESALVIGIEAMSRTPHVSRQFREGVRIGGINLPDPIFPISYPGYHSVAVDASDGAEKYKISKRMLDTFAMGSHLKWAQAMKENKFGDEISPIMVKKGRQKYLFTTDEMPRPQGSVAGIEMLPPVFGAKTTTAGNAPGLNDGSSAMVVMTEKRANALGLTILGTIVDQVGDTDMPYGISWIPASAIKKILSRTENTIDDIDLIEINEAFAAMPLVSTRILSENDDKKWHALIEKTNVNGGAIAIGHPVGASGLRITMSMMYELRRRGGGLGVAAICGGLTQGEAILVRV
ncbi:acetyl-CoA acetyltransferase [Desulfosarcina alkanivorans]|uniref:Acetyl-CoA acetyltransferase n=1 Tax=Desulfosarcina alkanivorans TaxID=571177 RepID=A0A5K7YI42_9BACT|nr:thiolase family protein [Desulfosarcina alkanivorans]BBO68045.1 acetyl-CoA acetyltransferase [Desulfosarcina alkanivorans]